MDADAVKATLALVRKEADARNWGWYYTRDEEGYYGPCETRDEAVREGERAYGGDPFKVAECHKGLLQVAVFEDIAELIDDANSDLSEEDAFPTEQVTDAQWRELQAELNVVAIRWGARHNLTNFAFDQIRNASDHNHDGDDSVSKGNAQC